MLMPTHDIVPICGYRSGYGIFQRSAYPHDPFPLRNPDSRGGEQRLFSGLFPSLFDMRRIRLTRRPQRRAAGDVVDPFDAPIVTRYDSGMDGEAAGRTGGDFDVRFVLEDANGADILA